MMSHIDEFAVNHIPRAVQMLWQTYDEFAGNSGPDPYIWRRMCYNRASGALAIARANLALAHEDICWRHLSMNPTDEALALLAARPEMIDWRNFSANVHREALARAAGHPRRLARHPARGGDPEDF